MTGARDTAAVFEIRAVRGPVLVQDGGRVGSMHQGVPPGGALVPEALARANRAVGNAWHAAALECYAGLELGVASGALEVATDDGVVRAAGPGDALQIESPAIRNQSVAYLAFAGGGLDVPVVLGGRGTLLVASLGGVDGRTLRRGDRVRTRGLADHAARSSAPAPWISRDAPLRVLAAPGAHGDALAALVAHTFTLDAARDRVGLRLAGTASWPASIHARATPTAPMVRGAIELPPSGQPIVLGPDHPTTGGYPLVAVIARADLGALFARPVGAPARFQIVSVAAARAAWAAHARAHFEP